MSAFPGVGDTFGRYEIVRRIGRGGMGAVFEARQIDLGRAVALKVLSPELAEDPDFRARFAREGRMLAALDSPHVIQVFDTGEQDGELFIATQLVNGRDLLQRLREEGALPAASALRIVGQVASALADAHEAGVLHRDVKPSNVLIRESRGDYFAYLCDFGIARKTDSAHTRTGGVLGTLTYLAPECHEGADASASSDLYSLGCVLWAALTGRAPFERTSEYQLALAHLQAEIPIYTDNSPAASRINAILQRSMAKDPNERFESAGAMHAAIVQAEELARGLRRDSIDDTALRSAADPNRTQLRVAHSGGDDGRQSGAAHSLGHRRPARALAVWAATLVLLVALGGTAVALLRDGDASQRLAQPPATEPSTAVDQAEKSVAAKPQGKLSRTPRPATSGPQGTEGSKSTPLSTGPEPVGEVVCWDSSTATSARTCPIPAGRAGLESVFPSMDAVCRPAGAQGVSGKAEVYECSYGDYMIRYSRWVKGADRYGYLNAANPDAAHPPWFVDGVFYGRAWVSYEDSSNEDMKYQWSASYRGNPYSVSVEGVNNAARSAGIRQVRATRPGRIGLP